MSASPDTLVCFAVKQEGQAFARTTAAQAVRIVFTGMGAANAQRAIRAEFARARPRRVLSAGFAGGLAPDLSMGTVLFSTDDIKLTDALRSSGALPARFHCAERVATTAREKRALREQTGADAVEMESVIICDYCHGENIPNAMVRVIFDTATEDLPLDFNALMNSRQEIAKGKLAVALLKQPQKVLELLRLQRRSAVAGRALGDLLSRVVKFLG